jgi:hypothetical protein
MVLELLVRHAGLPFRDRGQHNSARPVPLRADARACDGCVRLELAQKLGNRHERDRQLVHAKRSSFGLIFRITLPQLPPSGFIRPFWYHLTCPKSLVRQPTLNYSKHSHWPGPSAVNG